MLGVFSLAKGKEYNISTKNGNIQSWKKPFIDCDEAYFLSEIIVLLNQKVVIWLILPVAYACLGD